MIHSCILQKPSSSVETEGPAWSKVHGTKKQK